MFISTGQKLKIILQNNGLTNKLGVNIASLQTVENNVLPTKVMGLWNLNKILSHKLLL